MTENVISRGPLKVRLTLADPAKAGGGSMATKLTEKEIEKLVCPPGKRDRLVFDSEQRGLVVRIMAEGTKSYLAQYAKAGRKRRVPLGSVGAISLSAARAAASVVMGKVAQGTDPADERRAAVEAAKLEALRERTTLAKLVDDWTRLHLSARRPSYQTEAPRALKAAFKKALARPAERLGKRDVVAVLDTLTPALARAVAAYGRACFAWGVTRGAVQSNPFVGVKATPVASRDRVLTDDEAALVWKAALATPAPYGPIVALLLLTGQRRDEVGGMEWGELSADLAVWTIPADRAKNGTPNVVPLCPAARALLPAPPKRRTGLVFAGRGGKRFGSWAKAKAALDTKAGVTGWVLHDLRRTAATGLQRLGVRLEVTEAILNHVAGSARRGVIGVYQRHTWGPEKVTALDGWAAHVLAAVETRDAPGQVVPMRRGKRAA